jgi:uncharacterized membrane protein YozB (DUF420 family)
MSASEATIRASVPAARRRAGVDFPPLHRFDVIFLPSIVGFIWLGLLFGFVPEIVTHISKDEPAYLWIVHFHSAVFIGWMVLLTIQLVLIRSRNIAWHRRLGVLGFLWAPSLVIVGLVTSYMVDASQFGTPRWDPQFLSVQLADLINFGILCGCAFAIRRDGAGHKRLMMLALIALGNAGFSRWWGPGLHALLGEGFISELFQAFAGDFLILVLLIGFDLATRGKVHRVYRWGTPLFVSVEVLSIYLYLNPGWAALMNAALRP